MRRRPSGRPGFVVIVTVAVSLLLAGCTGAPFLNRPAATAPLEKAAVLREILGGPIPATPVNGGGGTADRQSVDPAVQEAAALGLDCAGPAAFPPEVDPTRPLVACDDDRGSRYLLSPQLVEFVPDTEVELSADERSVTITPDSSVYPDLIAYSSANIGKSVALVVGSRVLAAAQINAPIAGPLRIDAAADAPALFRNLTGR